MFTPRNTRAGFLAAAGLLALAPISNAMAAVPSSPPITPAVQLVHMGESHDDGGSNRSQRPGHDYRNRGGEKPSSEMAPARRGTGGMGPGTTVKPNRDLSPDDVRHFLEHRLAQRGNKRLQVGTIKQAGENTIVADIVTKDGALVDRFEIDRHTGAMKRVD